MTALAVMPQSSHHHLFVSLSLLYSLSLKVEIALTPKGNKGLCFVSVTVEHKRAYAHTKAVATGSQLTTIE